MHTFTLVGLNSVMGVVLQVHKVGINSLGMCTALSDQIFQKAVREPYRSEVFAKFCRLFSEAMVLFWVPSPDGQSMTGFKRTFLNLLQKEFAAGVSEQGDAEGMREGHKQREEDAVCWIPVNLRVFGIVVI